MTLAGSILAASFTARKLGFSSKNILPALTWNVLVMPRWSPQMATVPPAQAAPLHHHPVATALGLWILACSVSWGWYGRKSGKKIEVKESKGKSWYQLYDLKPCISFLLLLWQMTTHLVAQNITNLLSYNSEGNKCKMGLPRVKAGRPGSFLFGGSTASPSELL